MTKQFAAKRIAAKQEHLPFDGPSIKTAPHQITTKQSFEIAQLKDGRNQIKQHKTRISQHTPTTRLESH